MLANIDDLPSWVANLWPHIVKYGTPVVANLYDKFFGDKKKTTIVDTP